MPRFMLPLRTLAVEAANAFRTGSDQAWRRFGLLVDRNFSEVERHLDSLGVWIPNWTPVTGINPDSTAEAGYVVIGDTCFFTWSWTFGTSVGAAPVQIELPFTPALDGVAAGVANDTSAFGVGYALELGWNAGDPNATMFTNGNYVNSTTPFTWAAGDQLRFSGFFPIDRS